MHPVWKYYPDIKTELISCLDQQFVFTFAPSQITAMEKQSLPLEKIGRMMHGIFRIFKKRIEAQNQEEFNISPEQLGLLHAISHQKTDVIQKDMADMMCKDKSVILRLTDSLEKKGLVRRVTSQEDRRKNYLMITRLGYQMQDDYLVIVSDLMKELQDGLSPEEIETFDKVVSHILRKTESLL
jgi:MarR family transcriptional regulator, transcriptional regulator for hemolysin